MQNLPDVVEGVDVDNVPVQMDKRKDDNNGGKNSKKTILVEKFYISKSLPELIIHKHLRIQDAWQLIVADMVYQTFNIQTVVEAMVNLFVGSNKLLK